MIQFQWPIQVRTVGNRGDAVELAQLDHSAGYWVKFESLEKSPGIEGRGKLRLAQRRPHRIAVTLSFGRLLLF